MIDCPLRCKAGAIGKTSASYHCTRLWIQNTSSKCRSCFLGPCENESQNNGPPPLRKVRHFDPRQILPKSTTNGVFATNRFKIGPKRAKNKPKRLELNIRGVKIDLKRAKNCVFDQRFLFWCKKMAELGCTPLPEFFLQQKWQNLGLATPYRFTPNIIWILH